MYRDNDIPVFSQLDILFIVLFFVSFTSSVITTVFCIVLLLYTRYGIEGEVKGLILLTFRGVLSSAVASGSGNSIIRWIVLLGLSLLIILTKVHKDDEYWKLNNILFLLGLFSLVVAVMSLFSSSYPVTAVFKVISFTLSFYAILKGVYATRDYVRWENYVCLLMTVLMLISAVLIPFGKFRIVNSDFQGVFNHVNTMGTMCAIFIGMVLNSGWYKERVRLKWTVIFLTLIMCYLSASRTGLLSALLVIVFYAIFKMKSGTTRLIVSIVMLFLVFIFWTAVSVDSSNAIMHAIHEFMWKNSTNSIIDSRAEIIANSLARFKSNMITGTGFMVPYNSYIKSYSLSFNLIVEPGNLIYMLLGDTGIVGTVLFASLMLSILFKGNFEKIYLLIAALMINMGEMVFFSSNNYAILLYFLIALYLFDNEKEFTDYDEIEYSSSGI